jgi:hypothetical protein
VADRKAQIAQFARRCAWAYRSRSVLVSFLYGGVSIAALMLIKKITGALNGKYELFAVLFVVVPIIAFIVSQLTTARVRRRHLMYLRRHIRGNLFRRGLWEHLAEAPAQQPRVLRNLYLYYPQLCRHLELEPFSAEFRNLVQPDQPRFVFSHIYAWQLWRLALGEAVMQELGPRRSRRHSG